MGLLELSLPEMHLAAALADDAEDQRVRDGGLYVEALEWKILLKQSIKYTLVLLINTIKPT